MREESHSLLLPILEIGILLLLPSFVVVVVLKEANLSLGPAHAQKGGNYIRVWIPEGWALVPF